MKGNALKLGPENSEFKFEGPELLQVLQDIELMLISLHKIGSYYGHAAEFDRQAYEKETCRFIDEWQVCRRLASMRTILSRDFRSTLGEDDMDDLERAMESVEYWENPRSVPRGP